MLKKLLLLVYFLGGVHLHGSALGKRPSLNKISMSTVLGRLAKEMSTEQKKGLYFVLNEADKIQGVRATFKFLKKTLLTTLEEQNDYWGAAILSIIIGLIKDGIALRDDDRTEEANALFEEIKEMQETLFSYLQGAISDAVTSPRGSSDLIKREKNKTSTPLKKETERD